MPYVQLDAVVATDPAGLEARHYALEDFPLGGKEQRSKGAVLTIRAVVLPGKLFASFPNVRNRETLFGDEVRGPEENTGSADGVKNYLKDLLPSVLDVELAEKLQPVMDLHL